MSNIKFDFTGQNFAVTGASSGIGRQIALELAESGAIVLAIGRNIERLEEIRRKFPENIFTASLDVRDFPEMENAIKSFVAEHGKFSGGVHSAGVDGLTPVKGFDRDLADAITDTTYWAGMEFLRLMTKVKFALPGSSIVLVSSVDSIGCSKGHFVYAGAKAAVNSAVKSAAKEISGKGHRVNSILPGVVLTAMTENLDWINDKNERYLLGIGKPKDVSGAVLFLLSDRASWITGTNLTVDGGYLA